jgi:hypothetical protein
VRLLLVNARLDIARHRPEQALGTLENAAQTIRSRLQPTNPDSTELEALRSTAFLAMRRHADAAQHAQSAFELARLAAIDPASSSSIGEALLLRARPHR